MACQTQFSVRPVVNYQGEEFDFGKPFKRLTVEEAIEAYNPDFDMSRVRDRDYLARFAKSSASRCKTITDPASCKLRYST